MKNVLLLLFAMSGIWLQAQDSTFYYTAKNDSLIFLTVKNGNEVKFYDPHKLFAKLVIKGDTTYHYNADTLQYMTVKNGSIETSYYRELSKWVPAFKIVEKITPKLLSDGRCNGIKLDGNRCTRTIKTGIFFCWQHR